MPNKNYKKEWEEWRDQELKIISPLLNNMGFELEKKQVHIQGERYISSGKKLVLVGLEKTNNKKVIIKISRNKKEIDEIKKERQARKTLSKIDFAYQPFLSPLEILFVQKNKYYIFITEFIEQEKNFLERDLKEQFFLSLKSFEVQEGIHVTTYKHHSFIQKNFKIMKAENYTQIFQEKRKNIYSIFPENNNLKKILEEAQNFLEKNKNTINLYSDFLVHWDFVPHNFRIKNNKIYLLDHSSLRFGNKYEGQARFINFMLLYNRPLAKLLIDYIMDNRSPKEYISLKTMRIFRLGEILSFYANTIPKADENLKLLNLKRFEFWTYILEKLLSQEEISDEVIEKYKKNRDSLRSSEEKERQKKLH